MITDIITVITEEAASFSGAAVLDIMAMTTTETTVKIVIMATDATQAVAGIKGVSKLWY